MGKNPIKEKPALEVFPGLAQEIVELWEKCSNNRSTAKAEQRFQNLFGAATDFDWFPKGRWLTITPGHLEESMVSVACFAMEGREEPCLVIQIPLEYELSVQDQNYLIYLIRSLTSGAKNHVAVSSIP